MKHGHFQVSTRQFAWLIVAVALGLAISPMGVEWAGALTPAAVILRWLAPGPAITIGLCCLVFLGLFEVLLAFPIALCLYVPVAIALAPPWLLYISSDAVGKVEGAPATISATPWTTRSSVRRYLLVLAVYALVGTLYAFPWSTRKPFLSALDSIRPGMTTAEVRRRMAGSTEGTGWVDPSTKQELILNSSIVFRHSDEPQFNSDWGIVTIRDGRVADVSFSFD